MSGYWQGQKPGKEFGPKTPFLDTLLLNTHQVTLNRVRLAGFHFGLQGRNAYSIWINQSNISTNNYNLVLRDVANSWRIRDSIISQANSWGIYVSSSNDVLIDGNRFESNAQGAVLVDSYSTVVTHNRFELNGASAQNEAIRVTPAGQDTRILANLFSSSEVTDLGMDTQCAFNIGPPLTCAAP